jgi:hypothetical protein
LRTSGVAIMSLPRSLREAAANLISDIDIYNSEIETVDPGQRENARLTDALANLLTNIHVAGAKIHAGLSEVLTEQP